MSEADETMQVANIAMVRTIAALEQENIITHEQAQEFLDTHAMTYIKRNWLFETVRKFWTNEGGIFIQCLKLSAPMSENGK